MTVERKNDAATEVSAGSNVFEQINDRVNREETANHGVSIFVLAGTSDTMTLAEIWDGHTIELTGSPTGAYTLFVPSAERGPVKFVNSTGVDVSVRTAGQTEPIPVIPAGGEGTLSIRGDDVTVESVITLGINRIIRMTQAAYDALGVYDENTLYVIVG